VYIGFAEGGRGGDPLDLAQNLGSAFGKMLRIDPLGANSRNGKYGIPSGNPLVGDGRADTLDEIYAWGLRNPQRFAWDPNNGNLFVADIGQNAVEEVSLVTAGANLGWNKWEGSFAFVSREGIDLANRRNEDGFVFPVVEYDHRDPLLQNQTAITLGSVYRGTAIPQLANLLLFGDNPSGEIFYVPADKLPSGGQQAIRRVLLNHGGQAKTLLDLIKETNARQAKRPATRADLRFGQGPDGQIFVLNKADGIIRLLAPGR
jgi:glucose/arabinose dehydrogenase